MGNQTWTTELATSQPESTLTLPENGHVAVLGGGPAGSFFAYFLLDMARRAGLTVNIDIFEPRDFHQPGPRGCNMCGGIISESLVQMLALDGINLPPDIVQRGIDAYVLHTDVGQSRIDTPLQEKRIGAVYRGPGPRDLKEVKWGSFDGHLQSLTVARGAQVIPQRVSQVNWDGARPRVQTRGGFAATYDLLVVAAGVNSSALKSLEPLKLVYKPPATVKTFIREYYLGAEVIESRLGSAMHVFLLDLPNLEFAAFVPKGDYVSLCMLGHEIDQALVDAFLNRPEVRACLPPDLPLAAGSCQCAPRINVGGVEQPFADRVVFIGDAGVTRLYKDGIGAAFRTAKAAAATAIYHGISGADFAAHYWPACKRIQRDNQIGGLVFKITSLIQHLHLSRRAMLRMVTAEQTHNHLRPMSTVLWDTFTGSAPYAEIVQRSLSPRFLISFGWHHLAALARRSAAPATQGVSHVPGKPPGQTVS